MLYYPFYRRHHLLTHIGLTRKISIRRSIEERTIAAIDEKIKSYTAAVLLNNVSVS